MKPTHEEQKKYPVIFVGAGPGDPELITVKGQQALKSADLIVYAGSLVPEAVMKWAPKETHRVNSAGMHLDEIVDQMAEAYQSHQRVVRLHTGDPSLYGAIFEQMAELDKRTVAYRVVPGVTAAFAAAAAMGIEYTLPEVSQTLILTRMAGRTPVPEAEALSALAAHQASLVIYLSISLVDKVQAILSDGLWRRCTLRGRLPGQPAGRKNLHYRCGGSLRSGRKGTDHPPGAHYRGKGAGGFQKQHHLQIQTLRQKI